MTIVMTIKQKSFVKEYIRNKGNATKAALAVYDTDDYNTAHAIASENLQKPTIQSAITQKLEKEGITLDYVLQNVKENMESGKGVKATASDSLRAADMLLKVMGAYPEQKKQTNVAIGTTQYFEGLSKSELIDEAKKMETFYTEVTSN